MCWIRGFAPSPREPTPWRCAVARSRYVPGRATSSSASSDHRGKRVYPRRPSRLARGGFAAVRRLGHDGAGAACRACQGVPRTRSSSASRSVGLNFALPKKTAVATSANTLWPCGVFGASYRGSLATVRSTSSRRAPAGFLAARSTQPAVVPVRVRSSITTISFPSCMPAALEDRSS